MNTGIFLLLGTNIGDRRKNLDTAIQAINSHVGKVKRQSAIYQTEAWGKTDQPSFYNQVLETETSLDPSALLVEILSIEKKMGRQRKEKWGERIIDIDILFFGPTIINRNDLIIPHPQLANRRFTLVPLSDLIPDFNHPVLQKTIRELLMECVDGLEVKLV